ncbi:hypothetical protein RHGRI_027004 [Rhododendron griersonianum]|uniref:Uncharacterized protein n=1 Tax=Rhododendron griersonianum TaxID=479676 RepID=A0AAV6J0J1_9ERIC|nr:hypothetical protein RHGRI_027004 [Rhododendron griersonianum]
MQDSLPSLSSGILKRECAVRPFGKIDAATPEVAVASAILLADLMVASKARYRKVLPVPPGPSMKKEISFVHVPWASYERTSSEASSVSFQISATCDAAGALKVLSFTIGSALSLICVVEV